MCRPFRRSKLASAGILNTLVEKGEHFHVECKLRGRGGVHPIEHLIGCEKALNVSTKVSLDGTSNFEKNEK